MGDMNEMVVAEPVRVPGAFSSISAFEDSQRIAKALCSSPLVPEEYRDNIGSALIALELSQRMNMSPLMVMQNLDIIHGRPSWRSQMIIAAVNGCGRFSPLRYEMGGDERNPSCRAYATDLRNGERLDGPKIDMDMAKAEGWYGRNGSKWKTIPELMLRYRAASWWGRQYAPELLMGLPSADEAMDVIDVTPDGVVVEHSEQSRVASVAEKVASVAGTAGGAPDPGEGENASAPEWPKKNEAGIWIDEREIQFDSRVHGAGAKGVPAVTTEGHFKKRRGCDIRLHAQVEQDALAARDAARNGGASESTEEAAGADSSASRVAPEGNAGESSGPGLGYPEIRSAISRAATLDGCDEAADMLRSFHGPQDQKLELDKLVIDRRQRIESLME